MKTKSKLIHTHKDLKKSSVSLAELKRAHFIIALLAVSMAFMVMITTLYEVQLDQTLASIAAALLIVVAAMSLSTALFIKTKK